MQARNLGSGRTRSELLGPSVLACPCGFPSSTAAWSSLNPTLIKHFEAFPQEGCYFLLYFASGFIN